MTGATRIPGGRLAALLLGLVVVAAPAWAANGPRYVSSEPEDGARLHRAPERVSATFSEPLDGTSYLQVRDECGRRVDDRRVEIVANRMTVGLAKAPAGHYEVDYLARGMGGVTGQERGTFHFSVHLGPSCDGSGSTGHHRRRRKHEGNEGEHGRHRERSRQHRRHQDGDHDDAGHADHREGETSDHGSEHEDGEQASHAGGDDGGHDGDQTGARGAAGGGNGGGSTPPNEDEPEPPADRSTALIALSLVAAVGALGALYLRGPSPAS